jgi:ElaB/YqjD/DUF883 family membrane-anchored ribosome-binding protein
LVQTRDHEAPSGFLTEHTMTNPSQTNTPSTSAENEKTRACPADRHLPENSQANLDAKLDHAIEETFPTSDPVSVSITKGGAIDYDKEAGSMPEGSIPSGQDGAEGIPQQLRQTAQRVAEQVTETARDIHARGRDTIRDARHRYPDAERYYRDGTQMVRRQVTERPWLSLLVAGAVGYGIAWLIHHRQHD